MRGACVRTLSSGPEATAPARDFFVRFASCGFVVGIEQATLQSRPTDTVRACATRAPSVTPTRDPRHEWARFGILFSWADRAGSFRRG